MRETTLTHQTFRQGVSIKAVPPLHLFMVVRRSHMALATSATSARIFRVRHSSFTQPPVQTSYHLSPLLHGPLYGGQSLLSGTVICSSSSIPIYRRPD